MPTILDFQITPQSAESYALTVCERGSSQPLASATFSHRVDFLTDFSVDRLNASTKDPAERFDELQKLGRELYQKLFPPTVEQVWRDYQQRNEFLILCLRFAEGAAKLEVLPWETLHDGAEFIAAGAKTTLTRLPLDVAPPSELPPMPRPLKLFGFFASPLDLGDHERLNAEREQEILLEAINDPAGQRRISADFEDEAKLEILERSLKDGYHILHFTGHGISPRDGGGLLLEDAHGKKLPASIATVMQAVERGQDGKAKLRLAVISGCQTARTLHTGAFSDLARELLRQRVPAVIAMQFSISDEGGLKFAEVLYREIAKGVELERAVHAARRVLLADERFFINNDALAIVLLAADGACLQTTEAKDAPPQAEPGATYLGDKLDPLAHGFYGRRREYRKIRDALLHQDQRAVIIHGIGGIGKTALLTHAINRLRSRFKDVMSFDCRRAALAPETILLELHRYFATQGKPQWQSLIGQNVPPETLAEEIAKLLTEWPLLIVFDNFESQLDERRAFLNDDLRVFLATLVRATATGSRFLFTTRYLFDLDGERLGNLQELPLGDLSRAEALMLMQKLSNLARAAYRDKLAVLEKFGGHPYALVMLDRHCSHQPLDQALQDASSLQSELREYLAIELNYHRISEQARELLNRLAAFRMAISPKAMKWVMERVISVSELTGHLKKVIGDELIASGVQIQVISQGGEIRIADNFDGCISELISQGLLMPQIENNRPQSWLIHNLVRDFCSIQQSREVWCERLRDAAKFFTNQTILTQQHDNSQAIVMHEMDAIELLWEAEEYIEAAKLLTENEKLLFRWGFGRYLESWYTRFLAHLDRGNAAKIIYSQSLLLYMRGEFEAALKQCYIALRIQEEVGSHVDFAVSLKLIGDVHYERGKYQAALQQYEKSRQILEEQGDFEGVATLLHDIGVIHHELGNYETSLEKYWASAQIKMELGNLNGMAATLNQLGRVHQDHGDYEQAIDDYKVSLKIYEETGDRRGMAISLHQIGTVHSIREEYEVALKYYEASLQIAEEIGDRDGMASTLHQVGFLHHSRKNYETAIEFYEASLQIKKELKKPAKVALSLHSIGVIRCAQGKYEAALQLHETSLQIRKEIGDSIGIADSQIAIGELYTYVGRYSEAFTQLLFALSTFENMNMQSSRGRIAAYHLWKLRLQWGAPEFDAVWWQATGEDVPKWLMQ